MIGISKLCFGTTERSDTLRYAPGAHRRPIVVWNVTSRCNLKCAHCYAAVSSPQQELTTDQAFAVIDDLAAYGAPVVLFSGGEPFARPDINLLSERVKARGLRVTFSTNGTLIDEARADFLASLGVSYVGISIDGTPAQHDAFRGVPGSYERSLAAIRRLTARGVKVGLRVTMTRDNAAAIPAIFQLMRNEKVPRICLYHLVYTGRGKEIANSDLDAVGKRAVLESIIAETKRCFDANFPVEVLTVDNHADGPTLYLRALRQGDTTRAARILELLQLNGGNSSGRGIGCISWDGTVYPDQFWRDKPLGNVLETPFSEIWEHPAKGSLLDLLRHRKEYVKGRCRQCRWLDICGGNFRARGEAVTGDIWGEDPACYLTDEEIAPLA